MFNLSMLITLWCIFMLIVLMNKSYSIFLSLIMLEILMLLTICLMFFMFMFLLKEHLFIILLVIAVTEAVMGLSLLISSIRIHGNDKFKFMYLCNTYKLILQK